MGNLVTVGIPVYKRLNYLPQALQSVMAQDYPNIELIVSDNGNNGSGVAEIVNKYYSRPYKLRQNSTSVPAITHFNQIVDEACGEYFVFLADDDAISPNFISELVGVMECNPQVAVAFSKTEAIDENENTIRSTDETVPPVMSGEDFIRAWCLYRYHFIDFSTNMARTRDIRLCGGYPVFSHGNHSDNALVVKLCLNSFVAFNQKCVYRYRVYESSEGLSVSYKELAEASKEFLGFLDSDEKILDFARTESERWIRTRGYLVKMIWETYFVRWSRMYSKRLTRLEWIKAAFALPFISAYYAKIIPFLGRTLLSAMKDRVKSIYREAV